VTIPMPMLWQGASEYAVLSNTFEVAGVPTDPATVACTVTDPNGNTTTYTYQGAPPGDTITKTGVGSYQLQVPCVAGPGSAATGIFAYAWVSTGASSAVIPGTFTVNPSATLWQYYTSVEEMKDRLQIKDTYADVTLTRVVRAASRKIEGHCGRHFYQMQDTRTYVPYSLFEEPLDDVVSVTSFAVDETGDGVFDQVWVEGIDYELAAGMYDFNLLSTGEPRPYTLARVINAAGGGRFFPFTWPFSRLDRIQVTGVFGWPQVPDDVHEAAVEIASDLYKTKDAPFGIAGVAPGGSGDAFNFGTARVSKVSPIVAGLLRKYVRGQTRVGV
jgi:hypothetical protein